MEENIVKVFKYNLHDVVYIVSQNKKPSHTWPSVGSSFETDLKLVEQLPDGEWFAYSSVGYRVHVSEKDLIPAKYLRVFKAGEYYYIADENLPPFITKGQVFILDKKAFNALDGSVKFPYSKQLQKLFRKCTIWDNPSLS